MNIEIQKLKDAASEILKYVSDDLDVALYKLPITYYWDVVDASKRYGHGTPPQMQRGQVDVDWPPVNNTLPSDIGGKLDVLIKLSNLLRAVGDHVPDLLTRSRKHDSEIQKTADFLGGFSAAANLVGMCGQHQVAYQIRELNREQNKTEINISKLQVVADSLLKDVREHWHVDSLTIADDFYWDVVAPDRYKTVPEPQPETGNLSDDWCVVGNILSGGPVGKVPTLVQIANLLRFIGDHPFLD